MITYSTNWMGPISLNWYRERNLITIETVIQEEDSKFTNRKKGEVYEQETITTHYSAGRIDIRDNTKYGYDGWDEYGVAPMHGEDWNALSEWLDTVKSEELIPYETLIASFEEHYGKKIRWAE